MATSSNPQSCAAHHLFGTVFLELVRRGLASRGFSASEIDGIRSALVEADELLEHNLSLYGKISREMDGLLPSGQ